MKNTLRHVRTTNTSKIIDVLRDNPGRTVRQIAEQSDLSRATVSKILTTLRSESVVVEDGTGPSTIEGGKPPKLYTFDPKARFVIGMHFSGETLFGRLVDLNIKPYTEISIPVARSTGTDRFIDTLGATIDELLRTADLGWERVVGIGIGVPGVTDFRRGAVIHSPHNPSWGQDFRLLDLVRERIGETPPIYVDNAIRFRTIAEKTLGVLQGVKDGLVIHCDEGLISGVMLDGALRRGPHNLTGSIGHMTLNPQDDERCDCGGYGCFEMQVKPERLVSNAKAELSAYPDSMLAASAISIETIFAASNRGDRLAMEIVRQAAHWFAIGIHNLILTLDPEVVVIQGVYAKAGRFFHSELLRRMERVSLVHAPSSVQVLFSGLGEDAASLGAASYALSNAFV